MTVPQPLDWRETFAKYNCRVVSAVTKPDYRSDDILYILTIEVPFYGNDEYYMVDKPLQMIFKGVDKSRVIESALRIIEQMNAVEFVKNVTGILKGEQ